MTGALVASVVLAAAATTSAVAEVVAVEVFPTPEGAGPYDVAPAPGRKVWYTAQGAGASGILDLRR